MSLMSCRVLAIGAALGLAPLGANAATIDFRSSAFSGADTAPSFSATAGGVTTTLTPEPGGARLYWDSTDGIGVRWNYETDEIEGTERLAIQFSTPIRVTQIMLTDLFNEHGYLERGWYQLDGGAQTWFSADPGQLLDLTNGVKLLATDQTVSSIRFGAPGRTEGQHHEFSVARLTYSAAAVPEPASSLLTGVGGLIVGWALRRRPQAA
jgi:hypothetical protein